MNITAAAMPPAMYANSDRSVHFGPVNEPLHLQDGVPFRSLTHCPAFSQKLSQTSVHCIPVPLKPGLHSHLKSDVSGTRIQYALASQWACPTATVSHGFVHSALLV
jgi:hypothetical protein